ncbi:MAG: putative ABC transporter permease [Clostridia bacterium]|nr:putative ABC transporter permease [Clostridia bacterium]
MEKTITEKEEMKPSKPKVEYNDLFWLFLVGSVLGVIIEGAFCYFTRGHWESHVVSVWGWFNVLYGAGAAGLYAGAVKLQDKSLTIRVLSLMGIATTLEYICGAFLKYVLGMKAWDYSGNFLNIDGIVCLKFSLFWGIMSLGVCLAAPKITKWLEGLRGHKYRIICSVMSVFLAINFALTAMVLLRWSGRHYGYEPRTSISRAIDSKANDQWMKDRFVEWHFISK